MKINDLVEIHFYYGLAPRPVTLIGRIDGFEGSKFSLDEAVRVSVLPEYSRLVADNPVTVLGDRLSVVGGEPMIGDRLNYI